MPETKDPPASNPAAGFADAIDRLRAAGASGGATQTPTAGTPGHNPNGDPTK
jgi:hypothetical protein